MQNKKKYQMDMCHGALAGQIFRYSLPVIGANIMALMFHAADLIVLGQFAPAEIKTAATASVGASAALNVMLLVFFNGFGAGVNAITARYVGAKDDQKVTRIVHTSIACGIVCGLIVAALGVFFAPTALRIMGTPEDVIGKAAIYLRICSIGLPFTVLYVIGAAILRAVGDTRRPLYFIITAGIVNVLLNLFFVIVCRMDSAGVALATKISNVLSALLVLQALCRFDGPIRLYFRKIRFHWQSLKEVLWIGIPAGIQGSLYNISNLFIQSSVNSLGSFAMAGYASAQSMEGMANVASAAYYQSAMSFTGQNLGGKKFKRVIRSILICLGYAVGLSLVFCVFFHCFGKSLLGLYNPDPVVIGYGMERMRVMVSAYFLCGIADTITGALRGLGHSVKPTITTILGVCGIRIFWVLIIFPHYRSLRCLAFSYPVSWALTGLVNGMILFFVCRKMLRLARERKHLK